MKVLDFGLARGGDGDAPLTQLGVVVGTPAYMAPEQARGEKVDARGDLFSLGCVLYKLCTGATPFAAADAMAMLLALATETPKPVREVNPDVPAELSELVMRLLAKNPAERPQTAGEVIEALHALEGRATGFVPAVGAKTAGTSPAARPDAALRTAPASGGRKRRPWVLAAVAAGFLAVVVVATVIIIHYTDPNGKKHEQTVELPAGAQNPEVVIKPGDAPAAIPTSEPLSPLALVRKPAKIAGVESWSIETINPRGESVCCLSPDGLRVAIYGSDGVIRVWSIGDKRLIQIVPGGSRHGYLPQPFTFSPDGERLAVLTSSNFDYWDMDTIQVFHIASGRELWRRSGATLGAIAWSPNGRVIASSGAQCTLWDANTGERIDSLAVSKYGDVMIWSASGKSIALASSKASQNKRPVEVLDVDSGRLISPIAVSLGLVGLAWSHDNAILVISEGGGDTGEWKLQLYDLDGKRTSQTISGAKNDVPWRDVPCFTKDDKTILWRASEWSVADAKLIRPLQSERLLRLLPAEEKIRVGVVNSWSADGRLFAAGGPDRDTDCWRVYDSDTGKVVLQLPGRVGHFSRWDFAPDRTSLAELTDTSLADVSVSHLRIWELQTGRPTFVSDRIQNGCTV